MLKRIGGLLLLVFLFSSSPAYSVDLAAYMGLTAPGIWEASLDDNWPVHHRYLVWGGSSPVSGDIGDPSSQGYTLLGKAYKTETFTGNYNYYLIQAPEGYIAYVDAVQGSNGNYYGIYTAINTRCQGNVGAGVAADGNSCIVNGANAGRFGGYILINAAAQGLSWIKVYTDDGKTNVSPEGRAIISLGDYVLRSSFYYDGNTSSWVADESVIFKIDTNYIYMCGVYEHEDGQLATYPSKRFKIKRNFSEGDSVTITDGALIFNWTLRATGKTVETISGDVANAIILQEVVTGKLDPMVAYYVYSPDGHLIRSHDISLMLPEDSTKFLSFPMDSYFVFTTTTTGTALTSAPFYSVISSVTTQVNAALGSLSTQTLEAGSGTKVIIVPLN